MIPLPLLLSSWAGVGVTGNFCCFVGFRINATSPSKPPVTPVLHLGQG
jgi:hypothetical protein